MYEREREERERKRERKRERESEREREKERKARERERERERTKFAKGISQVYFRHRVPKQNAFEKELPWLQFPMNLNLL